MKSTLKRNILLKNYSTFKIGGRADYFLLVRKKRELFEAISLAKEKKIPFFILGNGSNVLFSDEGFKGLVIKIQNSKFKIKNKKIFAESGCLLNKLAIESIKKGLKGLEWAIGIPGTLGGAIRGNAGAFGKEIKDVLEKVKVLKIKDKKLEIVNINKKKCKFKYRDSIFKRKKNWIILEATLKLKKGDKKKLEEEAKKILKERKEKQPLEFPNAGSIFKNVPLKKIPKKVQEKFKERIKNGFLPAAVLIEAVNLKGKKIGGAKISEKHANFIINFKKAKAKDVLALIDLIKKKVKEKFKIELEPEIEVVI